MNSAQGFQFLHLLPNTYFLLFFKEVIFFKIGVLGSQKNGEKGTQISHLPLVPKRA